ncbi:MAG: glycosyltransferase family 2 protein [Bryobacteraceae bacterium]|nr:glycosyltransferase family 2 protein [Bryobacteraceae bacterium]
MSIPVLWYWILAVPTLLLALASLRGEARRRRYFAARLPAPKPARYPPATVIVPVKGHDEGLRENLLSLASLDYPDYELIIVARRREDFDAALAPPRARVLTALGDFEPPCGEKIENLLYAVAHARTETEVFAFADSDGRVRRDWLRALVAALEEPGAGAATGYRWHVPDRPNAASLFRSAWNAVIYGGMGDGDNRFAWGGAMAITRDRFYETDVPAFWRGKISDDYRLSEAVHKAGLRIVFAPAATVAAMDNTTWPQCLSWIRRQMMITRACAPRLWCVGLVAHLFYCATMLSSLLLLPAPAPAAVLAVQLGAGLLKGRNRLRLAQLALPERQTELRQQAPTHIWATPLTTWLWLWSFVASGFGSTIEWRGRRHRL